MHLPRLAGKVIFAVLAIALVAAVACSSGPRTYERDREAQENVLTRAQAAEPVYQIQNFLSRKAINEWLRRVDTPNKLWYIYLYTEAGFIGYHICKTIPLSYGVSMTNPKQRIYSSNGSVVVPAPGLDGVFYTGTDPGVHFCFDAETNALVTFNSLFVYYDAPLDLDVPRLRLEIIERTE